jgi:hypothetical protein
MFSLIISFVAISLLTIGSINSLDTTTCNTPGWFYPNTCSPAQCTQASNPPCSISETIDLKTIEESITNMTCNSNISQSTHSMCKNASLIQLFNKGMVGKGIVAVYYTNKFLIIITNDEPNHPVNLMDIPHPPAGGSSPGYTGCVTRQNTMQYNVYKIPLYPVDLGVSSLSNNNQLGTFDSFDDGTSKTPILGTQPLQYYPIPAEGTVGVTITGIGFKVPYSRNGYFKNFIMITIYH